MRKIVDMSSSNAWAESSSVFGAPARLASFPVHCGMGTFPSHSWPRTEYLYTSYTHADPFFRTSLIVGLASKQTFRRSEAA